MGFWVSIIIGGLIPSSCELAGDLLKITDPINLKKKESDTINLIS